MDWYLGMKRGMQNPGVGIRSGSDVIQNVIGGILNTESGIQEPRGGIWN